MELHIEKNCVTATNEQQDVTAEVTFPAVGKDLVDIQHTYVDDSLRGQGIAGKMMELIAQNLRTNHQKAILSCSYAIRWFQHHPEYQDVVAK
ncbi:MAG TPA: N-acetyltransferase [Ruminococcaceae bacterium]|nr:N-acetyltransferase [Oscillospiraceae bacterium]